MIEQFAPGTKIYFFKIKIDFKNDNVSFKNAEYSVLGSNETRFVINDESFSTIGYKKDGCSLDDNFKISLAYDQKYSWCDEIHCYIYTDNGSAKIAKRALKKELERYIHEKHGRYCKGMDMLNRLDEGT